MLHDEMMRDDERRCGARCGGRCQCGALVRNGLLACLRFGGHGHGCCCVCCAGMMQSLHDDLLLDMMRRVLLKPLCEGARVCARALSKG